MGELYNDSITEDTRFGGKTQEALENNNWLPCGDSVELIQNQPCSIKWIEGDTFYQRYDHLKNISFYPRRLEQCCRYYIFYGRN